MSRALAPPAKLPPNQELSSILTTRSGVHAERIQKSFGPSRYFRKTDDWKPAAGFYCNFSVSSDREFL